MKKTKELKKMSRRELLDLLLDVTKENEYLKNQVQTLKNSLDSREVLIDKAGSIAEASLQLSGIFDSAQEAADIYLLNLKKANEEAEQILQKAKEQAAEIISDAENQSVLLPEKTKKIKLE